MTRHPSELVTAICKRCGSGLAPAFGGRLRCPRFAACGYGGVVESFRRAPGAGRQRVTVQDLPVALPPIAST